MTRKMNFNAGPAALPQPALERARDEMLDFSGSGMSVMEHSHRGKEYEAVHQEAIALLRELLAVPATHEILFVQGGASQLFAQVPMNFLKPGKPADYVVTGVWGEKAVAEAKTWAALIGAGPVNLAADTGETVAGLKERQYHRVPKPSELKPTPGASYLHFTSNETIHGIQYGHTAETAFPSAPGTPLICDMSSDFLWRPVDVSKFDLIYAGAQKNIGPSGVVVLVVKRDFIDQGAKNIPKIFQLRTAFENNSLYNTPPTFGIYMVRNVLDWAKKQGGLKEIERVNTAKATALYGVMDAFPKFYACPVDVSSRSVMNVVFRLPTEALEEQFVADAKKLGMVGLKGHRSVGGIRVSLYNAVSLEWTQALCGFMQDFARKLS
jgi:phosphoserine aminotransferase